MLKAYIMYVQQTTPQLSAIRLICKENLVWLQAWLASFCLQV
jgi:hypothetical protein